MTDPKRWLDDPPFEGSLAERLIRTGKRLELPPETLERSWTEFSAQLASGTATLAATVEAAAGGASTLGTAAANSSTVSAGVLSTAGLVKTFVVGAVLGIGVSSTAPAVRYLTQPASPASGNAAQNGLAAAHAAAAPRKQAPLAAPRESASVAMEALAVPSPPAADPFAARSFSATAEARTVAPILRSTATATPFSGPAPDSSAVPATNRLKLEALEFARAKNLLESGDPQGALRLLGESQLRFARGALMEERHALEIEALSKQGERARAREAARRFLVRFPQSPLLERVKRLTEGE
jgi:hypothetical protein